MGRLDDFETGLDTLRAADLGNKKTYQAGHNADALAHILFEFREERAKSMDQPPFRVFPNQSLVELAQLMPRTRSELMGSMKIAFGEWLHTAIHRRVACRHPFQYQPAQLRSNSQAYDALTCGRRTDDHECARDPGVF